MSIDSIYQDSSKYSSSSFSNHSNQSTATDSVNHAIQTPASRTETPRDLSQNHRGTTQLTQLLDVVDPELDEYKLSDASSAGYIASSTMSDATELTTFTSTSNTTGTSGSTFSFATTSPDPGSKNSRSSSGLQNSVLRYDTTGATTEPRQIPSSIPSRHL